MGKRKESVSLGEENPKEEMQFQSGDENRSVSNV
jgi:hypothetical protein